MIIYNIIVIQYTLHLLNIHREAWYQEHWLLAFPHWIVIIVHNQLMLQVFLIELLFTGHI